MPIKFDFINGRELKMGSVFIPAEEAYTFYKVTDIKTSKPGKHGSAKSVITAKGIVNGKALVRTYLDSDEKLLALQDPCAIKKIVYSFSETEIVTDLQLDESLSLTLFTTDDQTKMKADFALLQANSKKGNAYVDEEGSPLVIEFSEFGDAKNMHVFWAFKYIKVEELSRHFINTYIPMN
jgi:translation elongation factor P/translation initiation factor 5A